MNYKKKTASSPKLLDWGSPKATQTKAEPIADLETVKHKHFPNKKFCKVHKGPHVKVLRKINYFRWWKDRYWFDYTCDCGKKYYEFNSPETFTEEQAKMYEDYKKLRPEEGQEITKCQ